MNKCSKCKKILRCKLSRKERQGKNLFNKYKIYIIKKEQEHLNLIKTRLKGFARIMRGKNKKQSIKSHKSLIILKINWSNNLRLKN